jgi:hypothetical protein
MRGDAIDDVHDPDDAAAMGDSKPPAQLALIDPDANAISSSDTRSGIPLA